VKNGEGHIFAVLITYKTSIGVILASALTTVANGLYTSEVFAKDIITNCG
jgi:hypothetical protein